MSTKADRLRLMIVGWLYTVSLNKPDSSVSYENLYVKVVGLLQKTTQESITTTEFRAALRYLIEKGHIQQDVARYRLTAAGEDYVRALRKPRPPGNGPTNNWLVGIIVIIVLAIIVRGCQSVPQNPVDSSFKIGDEVIIALTGNVRVRLTPGYIYKSQSDLVCFASTGERFHITDGPQEVDGLRWWKVVSDSCGEGWIAQTTNVGETILQHP